MDKNAIQAAMGEMTIFKDCSANTLIDISKDIYVKNYKKGEIVLHDEGSNHRIAILASQGRIKIFTENEAADEFILYCLVFGDIFNVITLLDEVKDSLRAAALDDIVVFHCKIDMARGWIEKHHDFNKNLLKYISARLKLAQEFNIQKTFYSIELRLAKLIFDNLVIDENPLNLINNLSHEEIAKMLGTSRAVVNRNLQKLKQENLIYIKRKKILIKDYEKFAEYLSSFPDVFSV